MPRGEHDWHFRGNGRTDEVAALEGQPIKVATVFEVEILNKERNEAAQFHPREVLSDAVGGTEREGVERVGLVDEWKRCVDVLPVRLLEPAIGPELIRLGGEVAGVAVDGERRD